MKTNLSHPLVMYANGLAKAELRSMSSEYAGCVVHLNARISLINGYPQIVGYALSDWSSEATVATFVDGNRTDL